MCFPIVVRPGPVLPPPRRPWRPGPWRPGPFRPRRPAWRPWAGRRPIVIRRPHREMAPPNIAATRVQSAQDTFKLGTIKAEAQYQASQQTPNWSRVNHGLKAMVPPQRAPHAENTRWVVAKMKRDLNLQAAQEPSLEQLQNVLNRFKQDFRSQIALTEEEYRTHQDKATLEDAFTIIRVLSKLIESAQKQSASV